MRVAYVHDWLVTYRGGEKVLAALLELYPDAPVHTLFYDKAAMPPQIADRDVRVPSALNAIKRLRKALLPILPRAIEAMPLKDYDLIISTSSCVAKGVLKGPGAKHLCYLHSPMRYIWDQQDEYLQSVARIPGATTAIKALTPRLRAWDVASSSKARVDRFVVNSTFVGERAQQYYQRESTVIHPPIELDRFTPTAAMTGRGGYVLAAGAMVAYKRFDLAIAACEQLGKRLIIAGAGPQAAELERLAAAGKHTTVIRSPDDPLFTKLLREAEALLFPGVEDFGMTAIEAMACGTPVIAYRAGGARDFIVPDETGIFFEEPTTAALAAAIGHLDLAKFDAKSLSAYAQRYGKAGFLARIRREIATMMEGPAA